MKAAPLGLVLLLCAAVLVGCSEGGSAGNSASSAPASPVSQAGPVVRRTDFRIAYRLDATTAASTQVPLVDRDDLVFQAAIPAGAAVSAGQLVGQAVADPGVVAPLKAAAASSRLDQAVLDRLTSFQGPVTSPVSGVLVSDDTGAQGPAVKAPGIDVVVSLTPLQALRYMSLTFKGIATVETVVGQREVPCQAVWVQAAPSAASDESASDGAVSDADTDVAGELHCRLPAYAETAPGLRAQVSLTSATIHDAVVVPNLDLRYDRAGDGYSVTIEQDGKRANVPVVTGVTDGVVRVITSPLPVGAKIIPPGGSE